MKRVFLLFTVIVTLFGVTACNWGNNQGGGDYQGVTTTLKAPVINPAGGDYSESFKMITIATEEEGDIFYTENGDTPTSESLRYQGEFKIIGSKTIKAIVISGNNKSEITTAQYNLGRTENQTGKVFGKVSLSSNLDDSISEELKDSYIYVYTDSLSGVVKKVKLGEEYSFDGLDTSKYYNFYFSNVEPTTFNNIDDSARAALTVKDKNGKSVVATQLTVKPESGNGVSAEATLKAAGTISGIAKKYDVNGKEEEDHGGIVVFIPGTSYAAYTNENGSFTISGVPQSNSITLRAQVAGYKFCEKSNIRLESEGDEVPQTTVEEEFSVSFNLGTLKGNVFLSDLVDSTGHSGVLITLSNEDHGYTATSTDNGSYQFTDVYPGYYTMEFSKDGYETSTIQEVKVTGSTVTTVAVTYLQVIGGSLSGSVEAAGLTDLSGISILGENTEGKRIFTATDKDGKFSWDKVSPGTYTLTASRAGYNSSSVGDVTVGIGAAVENVTIPKMTKATYSVSGKVFLEGQSSGYEGTDILLKNLSDDSDTYSSVTGVDGTFAVSGMSSGIFSITVSRTGFVTDSGRTVETGTKLLSTIDDITLKNSLGSISGVVTLAGSNDSSGINISIVSENKDEKETFTAVTDAYGHYSVAGIKAGKWIVQASCSGYNTAYSESYSLTEGAKIEADSMELSIKLRNISGKALLDGREDHSGISVVATSVLNTDEVYSALTNENGSFVINGLNPGEYLVTYSYEGFVGKKNVSVNVTEDSENLSEVTLNRAKGTIKGYVKLGDSSDYSGVTVSLVGTDKVYTTKSNGYFEFTVETGSYTGGVTFEKTGYVTTARAETIIVLADEYYSIPDTEMVVIYGSVSGDVTLDGAESNEGIEILLYSEIDNGLTYSTTTDSKGHYSIANVEPGTYRVQSTKVGYITGVSDPFSITTGKNTNVASKVLAISRRSIYGKVTLDGKGDSENSGITITATNTTNSQQIYSVISNEEGSYSLTGLIPGKYTLTYTYDGYITIKNVIVDMSSDESVTLLSKNMEKSYGWINGVVSLDDTRNAEGITVTLVGVDYEATTTKNGAYELKVPVGNYTGGILFEKAGYATILKEGTIIVKPDEYYTLESVKLLNSFGSLTGTVTLESAENSDGIEILVYSETDDETLYSTVTDISGHFVIAKIEPGTFRIQASKQNYENSISDPVTITTGQETVSASKTLKISRRSIYGTVNLEGKTDFAGVRITATKTTNTKEIYSALSNSSGFYALSGMTPGEYNISYSFEGYVSYAGSSISVEEESSLELESVILNRAKGSISGIVTLQGKTSNAGIKVELLGTDEIYTTDSDGVYKFTVPSGNYPGGVRFTKEDFTSGSRTETITVLTDSTFGVQEYEMKAIANTVKGKIEIAGTSDNSGIIVTIDELSDYSGTSNEAGDWQIDHIPLGTYTFRYSKTNIPDVTARIAVNTGDYINAGYVEMIPNAATLRGHVYLNDMSDHSNVTVTVTTEGKDDLTAKTKSDGSFEVTNILSTGSHNITFSKNGWKSESIVINDFVPLEERTLAESIYLEDITAPELTNVIINNGAMFTNKTTVSLELTPFEEGSGLDKMSVQIIATSEGVSKSIYPSTYKWEDYKIGFDFDIESLPTAVYSGNGKYTFVISLKDKAGNISESFFKDIELTDVVTSLSGVLDSEHLHLTKERSPYLVETDCNVSEGDTLIIDPGVEIRFKDNTSISVSGGIKARGTAEERILFTSDCVNAEGTWNEYGDHLVSGITTTYWNGIGIKGGSMSTSNTYNYSSGNILEYCEFEYAKTPIDTSAGVYINYCNVHDCQNSISINGAGCVLINSTFHQGISFRDSGDGNHTLVVNNTIYKGIGGDLDRDPIIKNNTINDASINLNYLRAPFTNNLLDNCSIYLSSNEGMQFYNNTIINTSGTIVYTSQGYESSRYFDVRGNYWGESNTEELELKGAKANISFISDYYDNFNWMKINYSNWLTESVENAGYLGDGFIAFDYTVNSFDFDSGSNYPETKDTKLKLDITPKYYKNSISKIRIAQSQQELLSKSWETYSSSKNFNVDLTKLNNGFATMCVQIMDTAGNVSSVVTHNVPFDKPEITCSIEDGAVYNNPTSKIGYTVTASDGGYITEYSIKLDDVVIRSERGDRGSSSTLAYSDWSDCKIGLPYMNAGEHKITIQAWDCAGNSTEKIVPFTIERFNSNKSDLAGTSWDKSTGQPLKDDRTVYLWHLDNSGAEVNNSIANIGSYSKAKGGFGGSARSLYTSDSISIDLSANNAFTIEYWKKGDGAVEIVKNDSFRTDSWGDSFRWWDVTSSGSVDEGRINYSAPENPKDWHYWSFVYCASYSAVYCDGQLVSYSDDRSSTLNTNQNYLYINKDSNVLVDEIRISNEARSSDEISAYYKDAKAVLDSTTGILDAIVY